RAGSAVSTAARRPCAIAQYEHARVQTSPRIMNVAVPWFQHSPMFGHCASSHTVWRFSSRIRLLRRAYRGEPGARTFSHSGFGGRGGAGVVAQEASGVREMTRATLSIIWSAAVV